MTNQTRRHVSAREGYARWAASYDQFDNPMTAMVSWVMSRSPQPVVDADVVELGCGTGRNVESLRALGSRSYVGIDESAEMLQVARDARADEHTTFEQHDVRLPWPEQRSFDVVLISLVLEHVENVEPVLRCAAALVRPGGMLWILELHPDLAARGVGAHVETASETLVLPSYAHDQDELCAALVATGWHPAAATTWYPTPAIVAQCAKLERYVGEPVLLEPTANRAG